MRSIGLIIGMTVCVGIAWAQASSAPNWIDGTWVGTSICTDLKNYPNCHDEKAIYHASKFSAKQSDKLPITKIELNKVVDGKEVEMGGIQEFHWEPKTSMWVCEILFKKNRMRCELKPVGNSLTGSLCSMPGRSQIRKITLTKVKVKNSEGRR